MAPVALVLFSSYCYSNETIYGTTSNAAGAGLSWAMPDVLPDASAPHITLQINGLVYRYTIEKNPEDAALVHVRNEDVIDGGYIYEETDNWSGIPGNTIQKFLTFPNIDSERWGDGEMAVEGNATLRDPSMVYTYRMDIGQAECINPLSSPECPGYNEALYKYLQSMPEPEVDDPYYDEWVQAQLDIEANLQDEEELQQTEEEKEKEEEEKKEFENSLAATTNAADIMGTQLDLTSLTFSAPSIDTYYTFNIPGGEYRDTLQLDGGELQDNPRALNNLANDAKHRSMVRSQYD